MTTWRSFERNRKFLVFERARCMSQDAVVEDATYFERKVGCPWYLAFSGLRLPPPHDACVMLKAVTL
jgi:hypothetical protein